MASKKSARNTDIQIDFDVKYKTLEKADKAVDKLVKKSASGKIGKIGSQFDKVTHSTKRVATATKANIGAFDKLRAKMKSTASEGSKMGSKTKVGVQGLTGSIFKAVSAVEILRTGLSKVTGLASSSFKSAMGMEQTQLALDALVGDQKKSQQLFGMLNKMGQKSVFSETDFLTGGKALLPLTKDLGAIQKGMGVMERLAMSNMQEGMEGATFSMREYLSGDYTSIVERFNLPRSMVKESLKNADTIEERMAALDKLLQNMGFTDEYVKKVNQSTGAVWDNVVSNVKMKFTKLARVVLDKLKGPLLKIQAWVDSGALDKVFDKMGKAFGKGIDVAVKVFEWIVDNKDYIVSALAGVTAGFVALKLIGLGPAIQSMWLFTKALLANPITWVVLAIGGLVAGFVLLYKKSDVFRAKVDELWGKLKEFATDVWQNHLRPFIDNVIEKLRIFWEEHLKPFIDNLVNGAIKIKDKILEIWEKHIKPILEEWGEKFQTLWEEHLSPFFSSVGNSFTAIMKALGKLWNEFLAPFFGWLMGIIAKEVGPVLTFFGNLFMSVFGAAIDIVGGLWRALTGIIQFITGVFTADWEMAWNGIKNIFGGVWDSLGGIVKGALNIVIDIINFFIDKINKVSVEIPDWSPFGAGKHFGFNIPRLDHFEYGTKGAYSTPDTFIAGENGPEVVTGAKNKRVYPANQSDDLLGNGGSTNTYNITINVNGNKDPDETAKSVRKELDNYFGSFGRRNPKTREV